MCLHKKMFECIKKFEVVVDETLMPYLFLFLSLLSLSLSPLSLSLSLSLSLFLSLFL